MGYLLWEELDPFPLLNHLLIRILVPCACLHLRFGNIIQILLIDCELWVCSNLVWLTGQSSLDIVISYPLS